MSEPGQIRDSLETVLRTIPQVKVINQVDESSMTLELITEYRPDLVLLVTDLSKEGAGQALAQLKELPQTQCLILANTKLNLAQAETANADEVLLSGYTAAKLFETVTRLLSS